MKYIVAVKTKSSNKSYPSSYTPHTFLFFTVTERSFILFLSTHFLPICSISTFDLFSLSFCKFCGKMFTLIAVGFSFSSQFQAIIFDRIENF